MDFENLRKWMVDTQIKLRGVKNERVIQAMLRVPRHRFVPPELIDRAYDDMALPIGEGQTISQPYMVAVMTELLEPDFHHRVLEIGTGSGYQAAVLAEIVKEVYTIERIATLSERARKIVRELGYENIFFKVGDGTLGWPEEAPFDRIIVTAAAPSIPESLVEQLREEGIIVAPVGSRYSQVLLKGIKKKGSLITEESVPCVFVPLVGEKGWSE
ncbi:MAG: protein-L-isoaspartate(D-aspartate) O-methyltransferase [Thermodesulfovibrionales bacterium]|nr:protein-L-isoaspartate(D-aspartate) O-methyltransferase [Thermodesulfovibrionales bacterium]